MEKKYNDQIIDFNTDYDFENPVTKQQGYARLQAIRRKKAQVGKGTGDGQVNLNDEEDLVLQ